MSTTFKPYAISELVDLIYEDNLEHFDNSLDDCDCHIHNTIKTVIHYWGE